MGKRHKRERLINQIGGHAMKTPLRNSDYSHYWAQLVKDAPDHTDKKKVATKVTVKKEATK